MRAESFRVPLTSLRYSALREAERANVIGSAAAKRREAELRRLRGLLSRADPEL